MSPEPRVMGAGRGKTGKLELLFLMVSKGTPIAHGKGKPTAYLPSSSSTLLPGVTLAI